MTRPLSRMLHMATLTLLALVGMALALSHPRFQFGTLVGDDAGYYLAIARNFCLGHGFSFDRVHPTNGFNPLMPMLLIPLDRMLAPGYDLVGCFRIATLLSWLVLVAGLRPLQQLCARAFESMGMPESPRDLAVAATAFMYTGFIALKGYYGMDAFLVLTAGLFYLARVSEHGMLRAGARAALTDGVLLGLAVLARVDSLPLAAAAFAVMALRARGEPAAWRRILARAIPFTLLVASYLAWNRLGFGDWLPISARLKSAFPRLDIAASLDVVLHSSLNRIDQIAVLLAFALALTWLAFSMRHALRPATAARDAMLVYALYLAGRLGWMLAFSRFDVQGSYFLLAHPFVTIVLLAGAYRVLGARGVTTVAAAIVVLSAGLAVGKLATVLPQVRAIAAHESDEWAIARRFHDAVSDHDVLYGDAMGLIGYASDRPWINGDGVANERAYQDAIRDHALADYLGRAGVTHVVMSCSPSAPLPSAPFAFAVPSRLHAASDTLTLNPGAIVLRERLRRGGDTELWMFRWRSPAAGPPAIPER